MGFLDRASSASSASSSFLSFSHSPEKRCSVLNAHIITSFLSASRQGDGLPCPLSQSRRFS